MLNFSGIITAAESLSPLELEQLALTVSRLLIERQTAAEDTQEEVSVQFSLLCRSIFFTLFAHHRPLIGGEDYILTTP